MVDFGVAFAVSPDVDASFVAMVSVPVSGCPDGLIQSAISFAIYNIDDSFEFVQVPITLDVILVVNTFDCFVELFDSVDLEVAVVAFDSFEDFLLVSVSVWVVGFLLVLRAFAFVLLTDGKEIFARRHPAPTAHSSTGHQRCAAPWRC